MQLDRRNEACVPLRFAVFSCGARILRIVTSGDGDDPVEEHRLELAITDAPRLLVECDAARPNVALRWGEHRVLITADPPTITVTDSAGRHVQRLEIAPGLLRFRLGGKPVFGLGQGGRQFDRRGGSFPVINGQDESEHSIDMRDPAARIPLPDFDLGAEGGRITIPFLISPKGWGLFIRAPHGAFDLDGDMGSLSFDGGGSQGHDIFLIVAADPADLLRGYADLTGYPHLPPLWSLGYLQSHRTLASRSEILSEAETFRSRHLPCDGLIYAGTGFIPTGWNEGHGSFNFNAAVFPDPDMMIQELQRQDFRVVLHVVDPPVGLHGTLDDSGPQTQAPDHVIAYWRQHLSLARLIDGWWPDVGDQLTPEARLARIRMYWDGAIRQRPQERPFALHRNGYAGLQRYGWLWSGDVD